VSRVETLRRFESLLTGFLEQAIAAKENRLEILNGLNRLDDIRRGFEEGDDLTDQIGTWFADHRRWLQEDRLRPADQGRVGTMLGDIQKEIRASQVDSPATEKIMSEIRRWLETARPGMDTLKLTRGPEIAEDTEEGDTIRPFVTVLDRITGLFSDLSGRKEHLLSVLDETLKTATLQANREALLLSALLIYYMKHNGYKVEPYLKRLKEAEGAQKGGRHVA
jgi:hypothetical protein